MVQQVYLSECILPLLKLARFYFRLIGRMIPDIKTLYILHHRIVGIFFIINGSTFNMFTRCISYSTPPLTYNNELRVPVGFVIAIAARVAWGISKGISTAFSDERLLGFLRLTF